MNGDRLYVTRKEFYTLAMNICLLILFTGFLAGGEGFGKLYVGLWAIGLQLYCIYKLRQARQTQTRSTSDQGNMSNV